MRLHWIIASALLAATPALAQDEPGFFGRLFGTDEAQSDQEQGEKCRDGPGVRIPPPGRKWILNNACNAES